MINRKWLLSLTLFCLMLVWLLPSGQAAVDTVDISENFPDADFREFVKQYDLDSDGYLSAAELAAVTTMNCSLENIADLTGIEHFTALEELYCYNNQLTSLDVSANTALEKLWCYNNQLTSLDVSSNTALKWLYCYDNQLTSLDVSSNTALVWLSCYDNQLTSLDVSSNTALKELECCDNQLTSLDVSFNTALTYLDCEGNQLTSLDVSAVPAIKDAVVNGTKDTSDSNYNKYSSAQGTLYVDKTVTIITDESIGINAANFPDADFCEFVKKYDLDSNGYLSEAELVAVTTMNCSSKNIANLKGIEHFTALRALYCCDNQLTSLDVSHNTALTYLDCEGNHLTSLNVSANTALTKLYCYNNHLTSLDVSANTALEKLWCDSNQLTSLDVSSNTALTELACCDNQLTSLDVSANTALTWFWCFDNQLTLLDVSAVPALKDAVGNGTRDTSNSDYDKYSSTQGILFVDKTVTIITDAPATYRVTYDANGGIAPAPATVKAGSKYTVTDDRAISPGKIFRGWRADGKEYGAGDRLTVNGDTVLVALWYTPPIDPTGVNVVGLNKALHGENPDQYPDYDMNGDGHVTIIDLVLMAQYVADKAALDA